MKISRELVRQVVLYGIIGCCSASLDVFLFTLLYLKLSINEFVANIVSVHMGIATSFSLNRKYNFKKTDRVAFRVLSFYMTGLTGLALSEALLWCGNALELPVLYVKAASVFIVATVQFLINKKITFGK